MVSSIIPAARGASVLSRDGIADLAEGAEEGARYGVLCFRLGEEEYGVDLHLIHQIVKPPPVTWVPRVEPHILGVVSVRGAVVTLIDLRALMGLAPAESPPPRAARVLIVERDGEQIGLLVDSVTQVRRLGADQLEGDIVLEEGTRSDHVLFVSRPAEEELVVIVDLATILGEKLS